MDEEGAAASIDDEMLSAMSALLIANIDLLATMAHVRVGGEKRDRNEIHGHFFFCSAS